MPNRDQIDHAMSLLPAIKRMRAALKTAGAQGNKAAAESRIKVYPGAPLAFNADYRPSYRKEAAEDGWKAMLAWFASHGVK